MAIPAAIARRARTVYRPEEDPYSPDYVGRVVAPSPLPVVEAPITRPSAPNPRDPNDPRNRTWSDAGWEGESDSIVGPAPPPVVAPTTLIEDRNKLTYGGGTGTLLGFNTDGYGGDTKAANSVKNTFGRIAQRYAAGPGQVDALMADPDFKRFFPNARKVEGGAGDKIDFGGVLSDFESGSPVGIIDVGNRFDPSNNSGGGWQWDDGGSKTTPTTYTAPAVATAPTVVDPVVVPAGADPRQVAMTQTGYKRISAPLRDLAKWAALKRRQG